MNKTELVPPRVITGKYKGLKLKVPPDARPVTDRVKHVIFDILQNEIENKYVLDLFAGSGNLGIEALSRGARFVYFVDENQEAKETMIDNLARLGVDFDIFKVVGRDYIHFIANTKKVFDIIFVDPPFKLIKNLRLDAIASMLKSDGILVLKAEKKDKINTFGLEIVDQREVGINTLYFLAKPNAQKP